MSSKSATASGPPPRPRFADAAHCPWCGAGLSGPTCSRCGLRLSGPLADRLWHASTQADRWLDQRDALLASMREAPAPLPVPAPAPAAAPVPPTAPAPGWRDPMITAEGVAPRRGFGVQAVLVGVGALLLAVAAVVFLAFSWELLGLTGRSVVVATLTLAVLGGAWVTRRAGLGATAEAVAAFGVVLVLLDAAAVRATGLLGTQIGLLGYMATSAAMCAVLLAAFGLLARLRAGTLAASVLGPLAPVLAGLHVAITTADAAAGTAAVGLGLVGGGAVGVLRAVRPPEGLDAERRVLEVASAVLVVGAALLPVPVAMMDASTDGGTLTAAGLALAVAVVAAASGLVEWPAKPRRHAVWWVGTGLMAALAAGLLALDLLPGRWTPLTLPVAVGAVALVFGLVSGRGAAVPATVAPASARRAAHGGVALLAAATVPAAALAALHLTQVLGAASRPWQVTALAPLSRAGWFDVIDVDLSVRLAGLLGLAVVAGVLVAWGWLTGAASPRVLAAAAIATAAVTAVWQPEWPLLVGVLGSAVLAVALVVAALLAERRLDASARGVAAVGLAAGALALTNAVLVSWASRPLSVPLTLVGALALVVARRRWPGAGPLLLPAAALATLVVVAAVARWAGVGGADANLVAAGVAPLVVAAGVLLGPLRPSERRSLLAAGSGTLAAAVLATAGTAVLGWAVLGADLGADVRADLGVPEQLAATPRPQLMLTAALAAFLLVAADPAERLRQADRTRADRLRAAASATVVGAALAGSVASAWGPVPVLLAIAAACALAAVVSTALGRTGDPMRVPVELAGGVVAAGVLLATAAEGEAARAWPVLLVLAGAAAVVAIAPDRRWSGWVALLLGSAALWVRLADGSVGQVEAYTLPPAVVLLVVAAVLWRRGGGLVSAPSVAGALLAVLPTAVAGVAGPVWRPLVVLGVAAVLLALAWWSASRPAPGWRSLAALSGAVAVLAVVAGPWLRGLRLAADGAVPDAWSVPEAWSVPAALALAGAAAVSHALLPAARVERRLLAVPALLALAVPSLLADGRPGAETTRLLALILVAAGVALAAATVRRDPLGAVLQHTATAVAGVAVLVGLVRDPAGPPELLTGPFALLVLAIGVGQLRRDRAAGSWPWVGTGTALLLVPSLLISLDDADPVRVVGLAAVATGVLVAGAVLGWQAPLVVGGVVLCVHAVVQLAPWIAAAYEAVPRWVSLGLAGVLLLALGARYERRLRDLKSVRLRVGAMR